MGEKRVNTKLGWLREFRGDFPDFLRLPSLITSRKLPTPLDFAVVQLRDSEAIRNAFLSSIYQERGPG
jgi:hypothetical protein